MSREFARDPDSLVFLRLGEALRLRGELDAAKGVAMAGLERYPKMADAMDLYAKVLVDLEETAHARHVWQRALEVEPRHVGAHKGLGFLAFSDGDLDDALEHLEVALSADPTDASVVQAVRLVRSSAEGAEEVVEPTTVFEGLEGADHGILLVNAQGRVLGGAMKRSPFEDVGDTVAAYLTGVAQESERTARLLALGGWRWLIAEGTGGNMHLTRPTEETRLLVVRDRSVPPGRLAYLAHRANHVARQWLESQQL